MSNKTDGRGLPSVLPSDTEKMVYTFIVCILYRLTFKYLRILRIRQGIGQTFLKINFGAR